MSTEPVTCLVTGSTGYVGGRLIPRLLSAGHRVRAMARNPDDLASTPWVDDVEVVGADLADPESLVAACEGVDVLFYLVHSMGTSSDFEAEEAKSADNAVTAARAAGVRRIVYLAVCTRPANGCRSTSSPAPPSVTLSWNRGSRPSRCRRASSSVRVRPRSR